MSEKNYQVMVIGGGPAGYVAAIRAAQLGFDTACVEARPVLGGTCLNEGCIPSKALLDSSERYAELAQLAEHGIAARPGRLDIPQMMARKQTVVDGLVGGVAGLLKGNGVESISARAEVLSGRRVRCTDEAGSTTEYEPDALIIAVGSVPIDIPPAPQDGELIVDSTGALSFEEVPKKLAVIGAGVIGLELGSVWSRLGSEVVLLEALDDFLPAADRPIARLAERIFRGQGLDIRLGCRVTATQAGKTGVRVSYQQGDAEESIRVNRVVVAVGRRPATDGLLGEGCELALDERGAIVVDEHCATPVPGVYAVGDAVRGPMLAHKGMEEGVMVAERLAGELTELNYDLVPSVIYTHPEIAWVGATEVDLKARGVQVSSGQFPFAASGRALASGDSQGQVRVLLGADDDRLLGAHVIGPGAAELVQQAAIAMEFGACGEDLASMMFSHPTVSEALHEGTLAAHGRALHVLNRASSGGRK
ncbi:MAG: dihydrolipoyl dehydrogenase [Gammaproteobacteria bacterium AqS3]|nr:dihydrolipoyl dehydrogenase [Gammaproteobacteria bacterium AqS3]